MSCVAASAVSEVAKQTGVILFNRIPRTAAGKPQTLCNTSRCFLWLVEETQIKCSDECVKQVPLTCSCTKLRPRLIKKPGTSAYSGPIELQNLESEALSKSYDNEDTTYDPGNHPIHHRSKRSRFSGWRGGVLVAIIVVLSVLLLNVILVIIAASSWHPVDRIATAFTGDCNKAARTTTALHLLINLLSSLLLGASNYCMQRLVSPTRKEVDACHSRNIWLDIGMPSVRNLFSINKGRTALWFLLALSSAPLHFLCVLLVSPIIRTY